MDYQINVYRSNSLYATKKKTHVNSQARYNRTDVLDNSLKNDEIELLAAYNTPVTRKIYFKQHAPY